MGEAERGEAAPRNRIPFWCANRHETRVSFASDADVPEHWDCVPTHTAVGRPGLVHWADPVKPWDDGYTAEQERWLTAALTVRP